MGKEQIEEGGKYVRVARSPGRSEPNIRRIVDSKQVYCRNNSRSNQDELDKGRDLNSLVGWSACRRGGGRRGSNSLRLRLGGLVLLWRGLLTLILGTHMTGRQTDVR